jgi:hypothetical protein
MGARRWVLALAVGGAAALGALALVLAFPVFFRADDALYLQWAATHADPIAAFLPSQATIIGVFRPLQDLAWWVLYRLFGLHPLPYQLVNTLLLATCLLLLADLGRRLFSPAAGWWAVAAVVVFFPYLMTVAFWFSDLSFLLETVLMLAAVCLLARALAGEVAFAWGAGAYVLAVLAKEPAAFIVPAAAAALLLVEGPDVPPRRRRRGAPVVGGLMVAAVVIALVHPSLRARQVTLGAAWSDLVRAVGVRWGEYSAQLFSGVGAGLAALVVLSVWGAANRRLGRGRQPALALAAALAAALFAQRFPSWGGVLLVTGLAALVVLRRREGVGAVWFVVPFTGLTTVTFVVRTYLFEAAFGLALVAGPVLAEWGGGAWRRARRAPRAAALVCSAVVIAAVPLLGGRVLGASRAQLATLRLVSNSRLNFRDAAATVAREAPHWSRVAVVDYADMGLDYARDILPLPDVGKAQRQKTMMSGELAAFLAVAGRPDLKVVTASELVRLPSGAGALLVVMNRTEDAFAATLPIARHLVFEAVRDGEAAMVYRVTVGRHPG